MRKQRIFSRMLLALMLVTFISTVFQPNIAYADITDVWQSAGGQGKATSKAATSNGVWINKKQGFRITVLDYIGEPAFTYTGKDHLDLVFNYPAENYSFYGINHKTGQNRMVADNIDELKNNGWATSYVISIGDTYEAFKNGTFQTAAPGDVKKAIENFGKQWLLPRPSYLNQAEKIGQ